MRRTPPSMADPFLFWLFWLRIKKSYCCRSPRKPLLSGCFQTPRHFLFDFLGDDNGSRKLLFGEVHSQVFFVFCLSSRHGPRRVELAISFDFASSLYPASDFRRLFVNDSLLWFPYHWVSPAKAIAAVPWSLLFDDVLQFKLRFSPVPLLLLAELASSFREVGFGTDWIGAPRAQRWAVASKAGQ